jgi:tripartite-type tricarboxylate transporter receptor subunit TctC
MCLVRCLLVMAAALAAAPSGAQAFPSRPLRIIVPYPPGASTDYTARLIGQRITESLGQTVVVENRGGGGGVIAAELAARAAPDGYTMLFATPAALCIAPAMQTKIPYDTLRDFTFISQLVANPQIIVTHAGFAPNSVTELLQLARAQPGKINFASAGMGSPQHLGLELLKARAKVDILHVPYKGGGPAQTDLMAGRVQAFMGSIPSMMPHVKSGKLKALGVAATERLSVLPNVPTIAEAVPGYEYVGTWYGLSTQAKVPNAIVARLNEAIVGALKNAEVRQQLVVQGSEPKPTTVDEFTQFVRRDCPSWARAVKIAGMKPE